MSRQRLYVVHGMGKDAVGLVGRITKPIAQAKGNIVDLRQDVLHGLFTIYMVVDLSESSLELASFRSIVDEISEDTELSLSAWEFFPVPRSSDKNNLLMICVGNDKPGIIAASSKMLSQYNANIEFAQCVGREDVFLMELLTDVSHVTIPVDNLKRALRKNLEQLRIQVVFQDEHVFIKRKRVILFHTTGSFMDRPTLYEIAGQTGIGLEELARSWRGQSLPPALASALAYLDGLPLDVVEAVLKAVTPSAGSRELVQTLKVMGYRIVLVSTGFSFFTDYLARQLDIDRAYGTRHAVDDDARVLVGELLTDAPGNHDLPAVLLQVAAVEQIPHEDITVISDEGCAETPGIRLVFNLEILLNCYNQRAMSKEHLLGLLGSFGVPRCE